MSGDASVSLNDRERDDLSNLFEDSRFTKLCAQVERIIANRVAAARADERERLRGVAHDLLAFSTEAHQMGLRPNGADDYDWGLHDAGRRVLAALAQPADTKADDR